MHTFREKNLFFLLYKLFLNMLFLKLLRLCYVVKCFPYITLQKIEGDIFSWISYIFIVIIKIKRLFTFKPNILFLYILMVTIK
jgi:hypothetical protein